MKPHLTKMSKHKSLISSILILSGLVSIGPAASMSLINTNQKDKIKSVNNLVSEFALSEKSPEINKIFYNNTLLKTRSISESQNNNLLPKDTHYIVSLVELIFPFKSSEVKNYIKDSVTLIKENLKGKFAIDVDKNSYFLWINFTEITKFENDFNMNFLQKSSFVDDVVIKFNKNNESVNNSINSKEREKLYNNLGIESSYNSNFASNRFYENDRFENIKMFSNNSNQNRIKVGVLESGDGALKQASLINVYNENYFKISTKIPKVYNRWGVFSHVIPIRPTYGEHATKVASIIGGFNGVNPYTDLYGIKLNDWNGVDNEFSYLVDNNVDIINNSYGIDDYYVNDSRIAYNFELNMLIFLVELIQKQFLFIRPEILETEMISMELILIVDNYHTILLL